MAGLGRGTGGSQRDGTAEAMPAYFFAANRERRSRSRLARHESGRVCQRVLMIANLLEGMEHEEAARLAGLSRSPRPTSAQKLRDTISLRIRASEAAVKPWPMPNSTFTGSPL